MTDAELIAYCETHSRTELGLIHRDMVKRLMVLAGKEEAWLDKREFWSLDLQEECKLAKERIECAVTQGTQS